MKPKRGTDWPWEVTETSKVVEAAAIVRDGTLQARTKLLPPLAKKYAHEMQAGVKFPPISLANVGGGAPPHRRLAQDGSGCSNRRPRCCGGLRPHHVQRLRPDGKPQQPTSNTVKATRRETSGTSCASTSRRASTRPEMKSSKSYRDMGAELGIKLATLYRWMELDHPHTFKAMGKDGTPRENSGPPEIDPDPETIRRAQQTLRDLRHYSDSLLSPAERFDLIEETQRMVEQMKLKAHVEREW